jgi:hypothetical protein
MWSIVLVAFAVPPAASAWQFQDAAAYQGRSLLRFRPVELADRPLRPLRAEDRPPGKALYGLLPVGNTPESGLALVWLPEQNEVWLDANGDGRFAPDERHRLDAPALEVPAVVVVHRPPHPYPSPPSTGERGRGEGAPLKLRRTIVLRRASDGGLRYAVRGYVTGKLRLGDQDYAALLADGNADGCFDSPAADRIWIDLDRDGRFDALTEQFPLGKPLTVGGKTYLLKPAPDGSAVQVHERPAQRGTLRLTLLDQPALNATQFTAQLVSNWGELVSVSQLGQELSLPVGRYAVEALAFQLTDAAGRKWQYHFSGSRRFDIEVAAGRETATAVLRGLALGMTLESGKEAIRPGEGIEVTPALRTAAGLYLVNCQTCERKSDRFASGSADICLLGLAAAVLDRAASGFM